MYCSMLSLCLFRSWVVRFWVFSPITDLQTLHAKFLGALARSGWLPQGFALRSSSANENGYENKRHIGSLARTGWMRTVQQSPNYYYRGGRGRDFRPPSFRGPKAFFLKSDIESSHCQCKRETPRFVHPHSLSYLQSKSEIGSKSMSSFKM